LTGEQRVLADRLRRGKKAACSDGKSRQIRAPDGRIIAIVTAALARDRDMEKRLDAAEHWVPVAYVHLTRIGAQRLDLPWNG
jgi:hypothetical protein